MLVGLLSAAGQECVSAGDTSSAIIMRFGGDVLLGARYEEGVGDDVHRAFAAFDLFRNDDITLVNLENPVTTRGKPRVKPFTFRMHPRFLPVLPKAGIDIVTLANNHIYDFGREGLFDTIEYLDSIGVKRIGAGRNDVEARTPVVVTTKGKAIAFLGYYGPGESPAATRTREGVAPRNLPIIREDIAGLKRRNVDYIVVTFHWGTEKATVPDKSQQIMARAVIDAGADAVIGHHPHVLQGIEVYKHGVIAYSLGNLVFGGNSRHTYDTAVFEIMLTGEQRHYRVIPVGVRKWAATELQGEEGDHVVRTVRNLSRIFNKSIFH